jgi:hypothetical protein
MSIWGGGQLDLITLGMAMRVPGRNDGTSRWPAIVYAGLRLNCSVDVGKYPDSQRARQVPRSVTIAARMPPDLRLRELS